MIKRITKPKVGDKFKLDWNSKSGIITKEDIITKIKGNTVIGNYFETDLKNIKII